MADAAVDRRLRRDSKAVVPTKRERHDVITLPLHSLARMPLAGVDAKLPFTSAGSGSHDNPISTTRHPPVIRTGGCTLFLLAYLGPRSGGGQTGAQDTFQPLAHLGYLLPTRI